MKSILVFTLMAIGFLVTGCSDDTVQDLPILPPVTIVALPEFSPGSVITISWINEDPVENPQYLVQRSLADDFSQVLVQSDWISGKSWEFTDLADGVTQYFRVKYRDDQENESGFSDPVS